MNLKKTNGLLGAAVLVACAGLAVSAFAQDGGAPPTPPPAATVPAAPAEPGRIRFNFKDVPFEEVVNFFSRESGLPVIRESQPPAGAMTFISGQAYSFEEALSILNLNLQPHGMRLRRDQQYLFLSSIQDATRKAGDVVTGEVPGGVMPDQILTLTIPLNNSQAVTVAEQIKPLIGPYGSVTPVPPQNMLIVVESAAQCRRIQSIVQSIDSVRPQDSAYRLFPLRHAPADQVFNALKGLIAEKRSMVIIDKDGKQRTVTEDTIQGLNLQPDARTNSIIAVGPEARLQTVEELIGLLDVPEGVQGDAQMMTFPLARVSAQEAALRLQELFRSLPEKGRPTIVPLPDVSKITVVAPMPLLIQARTLLSEIDPGTGQAGTVPERRAAVIRLTFVTPATIEQIASRLMTPRQQQAVRFAPLPDGKGLVATGPEDDLAAFEQLVRGLDVTPEVSKEVRQVRIATGNPKSVVERAAALHAQAGFDRTEPVSWTLDADARTVTLIGGKSAIDRFSEILRTAESGVVVEAEARTFQLERARPSVIAGKLGRVARSMLAPTDGAAYVEPTLEPIDELGTLVVRAEPSQFGVLEQLIKRLDQAEPGAARLSVIPVTAMRAAELRERALAIHAQQTAGVPGATAPEVTADVATNSLVVVADPEAMARFTQIVSELQRQAGPTREVRMIDLKFARAETVVAFLTDLMKSSESFRTRSGPEPVVEAVEATNSLLVAAQGTQFAVIEQLVRSLDTRQGSERMPLRILRLRSTDATNLALVLQQSFDLRPQEQKAKQPVDIQADAATNTLVVSAHPEVFPEIERIVEELNEQQSLDAEGREIRIFPLKVARAEELARTIDQMYPEPPIPIDPRTRQPRPDLQRPREVVVRADRATNSLIVDAPAKRLAGFEQIVRSLDQQKLAENVELRTYRVDRADLGALATTLRNLAASGAIYGGGAAAANVASPVTIDTEPMTRTLIVSGPAEVFGAVEEVLKRLDATPVRPLTGVKMVTLRHARADRLQTLLRQVLTTRLREQQVVEGVVADVQSLLDVAADPATNTLIISAPESLMPVVDELIRSLDSEAAQIGRAVIRMVPLTYAEAPQVAQALNQTLPTVELPTGGRVLVLAAGGANALMISGAEADLKKVEELIAALDAKPVDADRQEVATYTLKHADATTLAPMVQRLLTDQLATDPRILLEQIRARRGQLPTRPPVRVEADSRNNWLVVSGPGSSVELAKSIIERLDQPPDQPARSALVFTPTRADPGQLAQTVSRIVNETLPQGRRPVELVAEPRSGSIVILGTPEQTAEAVRRLAEFDDRAAPAPGVDLAVVELDHGDARAVAGTVQAMLADRSRWPEALRQAERSGLGVPQPTVNADPRANRLMVSAPTVLMPVARELIRTLDQPATRGTTDVRVFRLTRGDANSAAAALRTALVANPEPGEPAPVVTPDPSSNTIVVAAAPRRLEQAAKVVESLDEGMKPDEIGVRTIYLRHARAENVAPVLEGVLKRESVISLLPPWQVGQYLAQTGGKTGDEVRVAAERRLNAVVISAPRPVLELAEQVVIELDSDPAERGGTPDRPVRIITLANADANELSVNLQAVFAEQADQEPPTIRVDRSSNSLIVRANDAQMRTIGELAERLDQATLTSSRQVRMIPVDRSRADAALMAQTLKRLLEQQGGVKVEVISAEDLLKQTEGGAVNEKPRGDAGGGRSFFATALALAALTGVEAEQPPAPAEEPGVTIAVDPATNSLIVVGSPRVTDRLAALASAIERQMPAEPTKVRFVTLPDGSDAGPILQVLQETIRQVGRASATNPSGFTGPVTAAPDPSGGALIVWANDTDFRSVAEVITTVSRLDTASSLTVKVYPLTTVTAQRAIQAVQDLLAPSPRGRQAQRVRQAFEVTMVDRDGRRIEGRIDPSQVRMTSDPGGTSVIVAAPADTIPLIDQFIATMDQSPVSERLSIRRYELKNARSTDLSQTMQRLFDAQRQGPAQGDLPQARFVPDDRTNTMLVTASETQHTDVTRLLESMDADLADPDLKLEVITLQNAQPTTVQQIVEQVVIGRDPGKRERVRISASNESSLFVVRAPADQIEEIRAIVAQVDTAETSGLPVRSVKLERADAQTVAAALQRFFTERATVSSRPGRRVTSRVAVVGDRRTGTLVVTASDDDFAQIQSLVATFDAPTAARDMQFRIIQLEHARATELDSTLSNISSQLQWERIGFFGPRRGDDAPAEDRLYVDVNERTNTVVLLGQGQTLDRMEQIVKALDRPVAELSETIVRAVPVPGADLDSIVRVIREATRTPGLPWWRDRDPDAVVAQADNRRRVIILVGKRPKVERAVAYIEELSKASGRPGQTIESISLRHADADRAGQSLRRFFVERAQAEGLPQDAVSVVGSRDGNVLLISADAEHMRIARDLVAQIDQPELGDDRRREVYALKNAKADDLATVLRSQFPRTGRSEAQVIVTPQPSTNSLIVSAPTEEFAQLDALIQQLDSAKLGDTRIVTVRLKTARASEVVEALRAALPGQVTVKVTPLARNNAVLLTGSEEAITLAEQQIALIDGEPERTLVEFQRIKLTNAIASEVSFTLQTMLRARPRSATDPAPTVDYSPSENALFVSGTAEQLRDIAKMVESLDVASDTRRTTEFVRLEFANAEQTAKALEVFYGRFAPEAGTPGARNVTIVPDPASNSLVISADAAEWEGIRGLLRKLDTVEYDSSRQITVLPLKHADAASVARALNEGFRQPLEDRVRREQLERQRNRQGQPLRPDEFFFPPPVLVDAEGTPSVTAEVQTNSLVVFAGRRELERIRELVVQIDVPDFNRFPPAHVIPLESGKASALAQSLRELYQSQQGRGGGSRAVLIVGDDSTNALIVRAEEADFAQIRAMADTLQQEGDKARASVRVLTLRNVPAARLQKTISTTFTQTARQQGEVLAVEVDRSGNALVIASSQRLFDDIERVVRELDGVLPGAPAPGIPGVLGQSVFIIDVQNNSPAEVRRQLEELGLTRPAPDDRQSLVSEPVTIVPLLSRRALAVVASPKDGEAVVSLVRALDADPAHADQEIAVIALRMATAASMVETLKGMLNPADQASQTSPARALAEQVRRLNVVRTGIDQTELRLDLSKPIRLIADGQTNSVIIGSTRDNLPALTEIVRTLDTLPLGDAVVVRIFPLVNASATRVKSVVEELFNQGEALRRLPGTQRRGLPSTATGKALAGEIAISVDDRTNTLIVAAREEAVAFVEVLVKDLDSDASSKWVETQLIALKFADAATIAGTLRQVLVQGLTVTPEAIGLQRQIGRLRMVRTGKDLAEPDGRIQADLFAPLTGLVIQAEEQLNALIVIGSPANNEVVRELVAMLDVEAAAASNTVRIFPLQYAAADRVAAVINSVFQQRSTLPGARPEDRVFVTSDLRTNALVISTSPKSFSILDALVRTLDSEKSNPMVGIHVIPVVGADAAALAPRILGLMRERISAAQVQGGVRSPTDAFSIEADRGNNLLIVACSDENLEIVRELVTALAAGNAALAGAQRTDVVQLKTGRAADAAGVLRELYVEKENAKRGAGSVTVVLNERLNALVVTGEERDLAAIRRLVERMDTAEVTAVQNIRFFELRSANALEVVNLLQNVLSGRSVVGAAGLGMRQATNLRFIREKIAGELEDRTGVEPTQAQVDGAIRELVTLTPDLRTNRVIASAPPEMMRLLEEMIGELDSAKRDRRVEMFSLKNADARAMAELLREVFNLRQQGNLYVLVPSQVDQPDAPQEPSQNVQPFSPLGDMRFTPVPDERQQLSIAIDARTNTLIVSGTDTYLEQVGKLVRELDNVEATERERIVFHLKNARASEVEASLARSFRDESALQRSLLGGDLSGAVLRQLEQEVTVVGDEKSNKLIITVAPRYTQKVLELVKELDAAPPQVLIQVLLAEVTLDSSANWGVDFRVKNVGGDNFTFGSLAAGAGVAAALGVPNLTFSSADFELLVRALEAQGKLQVLSRPSVIVNNNERGFIQVGEDIAIVTDVAVSDSGRTTANVERRDVGIILNVTPSISSDGFVRMALQPEISTLSQKTTQISEDFLAPIISKRQVDTVVTVKDGQTVVIGGLIQTTKDERKTKVPLIGDLPFIGSLFRSVQTTDVKTELLVILTPKVIFNDTPGGVDRLNDLSEQRIDAVESAEVVRETLRGDGMIDRGGGPAPRTPAPADSPPDPQRPPK